MSARAAIYLLAFAGASGACIADQNPVNIGPVALNGTAYASAATVTANALGSGVDGPQTAQTGVTINISKDNWWTGGMIGEIDGLNVLLRQNGPNSDASGILVNVQNQGKGFLSATEFASTIVDPVSNTLTYGIDVQEGVLDRKTATILGLCIPPTTARFRPGCHSEQQSQRLVEIRSSIRPERQYQVFGRWRRQRGWRQRSTSTSLTVALTDQRGHHPPVHPGNSRQTRASYRSAWQRTTGSGRR